MIAVLKWLKVLWPVVLWALGWLFWALGKSLLKLSGLA